MKTLLVCLLFFLSTIVSGQQIQAPKALTDDQVRHAQRQALEAIEEIGKKYNGQANQEFVFPKSQLTDDQRIEINRQAQETVESAKRYFIK